MRREHLLVAGAVAVSALSISCRCGSDSTSTSEPTQPPIFRDDFARAELGDNWDNTGGPYRIVNGQLNVRGAMNHPLWLKTPLPRDVRIDFEARSESPEGDIKVEVFGDGKSFATAASYNATSYVVIFGGWGNQVNCIARMDEHANDRAVGPSNPVLPAKTYRIRIERKGSKISAWADGTLLASMNDSAPLEGPEHRFFAFNNWSTDLWFDNLVITPL